MPCPWLGLPQVLDCCFIAFFLDEISYGSTLGYRFGSEGWKRGQFFESLFVGGSIDADVNVGF